MDNVKSVKSKLSQKLQKKGAPAYFSAPKWNKNRPSLIREGQEKSADAYNEI